MFPMAKLRFKHKTTYVCFRNRWQSPARRQLFHLTIFSQESKIVIILLIYYIAGVERPCLMEDGIGSQFAQLQISALL